jgi:hypothetical protein
LLLKTAPSTTSNTALWNELKGSSVSGVIPAGTDLGKYIDVFYGNYQLTKTDTFVHTVYDVSGHAYPAGTQVPAGTTLKDIFYWNFKQSFLDQLEPESGFGYDVEIDVKRIKETTNADIDGEVKNQSTFVYNGIHYQTNTVDTHTPDKPKNDKPKTPDKPKNDNLKSRKSETKTYPKGAILPSTFVVSGNELGLLEMNLSSAAMAASAVLKKKISSKNTLSSEIDGDNITYTAIWNLTNLDNDLFKLLDGEFLENGIFYVLEFENSKVNIVSTSFLDIDGNEINPDLFEVVIADNSVTWNIKQIENFINLYGKQIITSKVKVSFTEDIKEISTRAIQHQFGDQFISNKVINDLVLLNQEQNDAEDDYQLLLNLIDQVSNISIGLENLKAKFQ